jgi:sortase A
MSKYKFISFAIILLCLIISLKIIIAGLEQLEELKVTKDKLEMFKNNPNLLDPKIDSANGFSYTSQLLIPKIGADYWIRSDTVNAYNSVYHYPESVYPGEKGECAILGHRTTYSGPFHNLGSLKVGDQVIINDQVLSKQFIYKVFSNGKDIRWDYKKNPIKFDHSSEPRLLLITCYPPGRKQAAWITHCKLFTIKFLNRKKS